MALPDILPVTDFFEKLPLLEFRPVLPSSMQTSGRTAGGSVLTASLGARLWSGTVYLKSMRRSDADGVLALLYYLEEPGRFLLAHPFPRCKPKAGGEAIETAAPTISSLAASNKEMRVQGLPANYELSVGDHLSFSYGENPLRRAFHRIVAGAGASSSAGLSTLLEVTPHIRPGAAVGAAVRLVKPIFKAMVVPGSVNPGAGSGPWISGISFDVQQTLR